MFGLQRIYRAGAAAALAATIFGGTASAVGTDGSAVEPDMEQQVVAALNQARAQAGLPLVIVDPRLTELARQRDHAMMDGGFLSHCVDGSESCSADHYAFAQLLGGAGLPRNVAGEILAANNIGEADGAASMVSAWLASPTHRPRIMNPNFNVIGMGILCCISWNGHDGVRFATGIFDQYPADLRDALPPALGSSSSNGISWTAANGHTVGGGYLAFLRAHGDIDNLGLPRSGALNDDPVTGWPQSEYFQRTVLDYHAECSCIKRRLLADVMYPGIAPGVGNPENPTVHYFLETHHTVSNRAPDGRDTGFRDYFDSHGQEDAFGYPKEEPVLRGGRWTQRFQAAVFEVHAEAPAPYRVQLELLGDEYISQHGLRLP